MPDTPRLSARYASAGFTIIEVLVVLAVAGMILLMVFIVVPTMQRNARNNQRKHDVHLIDAARQEYDMNNPTAMIPSTGTCGATNPYNTLCDYMRNLSFYRPQDITFINNAYTPPTTVPTAQADKVISSTYLVCNGPNATTAGATSHSVAIIFMLETSSGTPQAQCAEAGVIGN